jgi:hypothetical protein
MTLKYFEDFFDEKEIPYKMWEIQGKENVHFIDTETVVSIIKSLPEGREAVTIRHGLMLLDLHNAPILPYLEHVATAYVHAMEA